MSGVHSKPVPLAVLEDFATEVQSVLEWEEDTVIGKRKATDGGYEYLVKPKDLTAMCAIWKRPFQILDKTLVENFEMSGSHIASHTSYVPWYTTRENINIQWKDYPYWIVAHGAGQLNKFCIVGLDKTGEQLRCKKTQNPNQTTHRSHATAVAEELTRLGLRIHHKTISPKFDLFLPAKLADKTRSVTKPISKKPIPLTTSAEMHKLRQTYMSPHLIPSSFRPSSHPRFCQCESQILHSDGTTSIICKTGYKPDPTPAARHSTLWLPYGKPITNLVMYVWQCTHENPSCNIYYDGAEDGIFVWSTQTMVSHAVAFEFFFSLISGYDNRVFIFFFI